MNIALLGYGRMGKVIEKMAQHRGHSVLVKVDEENCHIVTDEALKRCDVAMDFSTAVVAPGHYRWCFDNGVPVVSGTTGWLEQWNEVLAYCKEKEGGFFYASNFSIGMNIFFHLNKALARMMNRFGEYKIAVEEIHHIHKQDAPSGTAITLAEGILANHSAYQNWVLTNTCEAGEGVLPVTAVRQGEEPGIHRVTYRSEIDLLSIHHGAFSRDGFASGALLAAEFMQGRKGVYGMDALLGKTVGEEGRWTI